MKDTITLKTLKSATRVPVHVKLQILNIMEVIIRVMSCI